MARRPLARAGLAALALVLGCAPAARVPVAPPALVPAPEVQRLVDPRPAPTGPSWLGGDVASSVAVGDGRWIWIFGDTLLGNVRADCPGGASYCDRVVDERPDRTMIANSVGVMTRGPDGALRPLEKHWRTVAGMPAPLFEAAAPGELLWPLAVAEVDGVLLIAASRHTRAAGLRSLGSVLVRVEHPGAPPDRWGYTRHPLPGDVVDPEREPLLWSTALVPEGAHVYVVGRRGDGPASRTVLARLRAADVRRADWRPAPEYLLDAPDGGAPVWSRDLDPARLHVVEGLPGTSEAALVCVRRRGCWTYRIAPLDDAIHLYTAPRLTGPWRDRGVAYEIPGLGETYSAYAAKEHPELGGAVSYNVNVANGSLAEAVRAAEEWPAFYVPRMLAPP